MSKITVLGAGMVGRAMALDLANEGHDVLVADISEKNLSMLLGKNVTCINADLSRTEVIQNVIKEANIVIGAVPGFMGFDMLKTVIMSGKNIVDISFFPEDPFLLDELAKQYNVTAVMDCGVAPGMDNIFLGHHIKSMKVNNFECLVGGLPMKRTWPYQYKAPFSPIDVIEEYLRPARIVKNGEVVVKPALSEPEYEEFENVGTLESFNTDGLRSLIRTMDIPNMIERTLRYPGHIEYMRVLRETGFLSYDPVNVDGTQVRPIDLTSKLLFPKWKLEEGEDEFTVMRVIIEGEENGKSKKYRYDLYDRYDKASNVSSMSRTTGYTCTAVAGLILKGKFNKKGVFPPEFIGLEEGCLEEILAYQKKRNINYVKTEE
jgi:lysine 6-dehydrogenase